MKEANSNLFDATGRPDKGLATTGRGSWPIGNQISRRRFLQLAAAVGGGLALGACGGNEQQMRATGPTGPPKRGGTLKVGLSTDVSEFEPHVSTGAASNMIRVMVYSALLTYDKKGELIGNLAEDFGWADDSTYEIKLRKGVQFHNGDELTPEDVVFTFQRIKDEETAADLADRLSDIETVEPGDGNAIRFRLRQPNAILPYLLADPSSAVVSRKWIESGANPKTEAMGTGPFKLVERVPGVSIKLESNDAYFVSELPYLDGITFQPMPDDNARVNALRSGFVDFIDYVPYTSMDIIERSGDLILQSDKVLGFGWMGFVVDKQPVDEQKVRQAFAYGMDREKLVQTAFSGHGVPINGGFIPEGWIGHSPDLEGVYEPDYDRAKKLLQEAGLANPSVDILSTSAYSVIARPAEAAQAELKNAGIDGKLVMQEWLTFLDTVEAGTYPIHVWGSTPDFNDPDFLSDYVGSDGWFAQYINFKDEKIDELLLEGRRAVGSPERRGEIYHDVQERMLDLAPWALLIRREQGEAMASYVGGYTHIAAGAWSMITLRETWLDK